MTRIPAGRVFWSSGPVSQARRGKATGSSKARGRQGRSGRADVIKLAVLALVIGGLVLFPEQVTRTYTSVVTAVFTPVAEDIVGDLQENMAPTPAP